MRIRLGLSVILALAAAFGSAQGISYTFDSSSQGWTKGNLGSSLGSIDTGTTAADWDPLTQAVLGADHSSYAFHFSPNLGGGYGHLFGKELSADYRSVGSGGNDPFLVLLSSTSFLVLPKVIPATPNLVSYSFTLDDTTGFYFNSSPYYNGGSAVLASNAQIQSVLDDLQYIGFSTDIAGGADTTYLDNVNAVPEPFTFALLAAGGLALAARKRRLRA